MREHAILDLADEVAGDEPDYWRACADGDAAVAKLREIQPGPELAAALAEATPTPMSMSTDASLALYAAWERQRSWTDSMQMNCLSSVLPQEPGETDAYVAAELGLLTGLSEASMGTRLSQLRCMRDGLSMTYEALKAGRITSTHAWMMTKVTELAEPGLRERVEDAVLEEAIAKGLTPGKLGGAARMAMAKLDPQGLEQRAANAKKHGSDVFLSPEEDEMARLTTRTSAWSGRQMMDKINRDADERKRAGDERPIGQVRADVLAEMVLGRMELDVFADDDDVEVGDDVDPTADTNGRSLRVPNRAAGLLLITLDTLLGGDGPGHLDGYGAISAPLARRIAGSDIRFRRLVLDPLSGRPVDLGATSYKLSPEMRRWLEARDRTCRFPNCERRAVFCDADHCVEFPEGETNCRNCGLLCRRHHNWKTRKDWDLIREDDDVIWISPHGLRFRKKAATYKEFLPWPDGPPPNEFGLDERTEALHSGLVPADPDPPDPDAPWPDTDPTLTIPAPACACEDWYDDIRSYEMSVGDVAPPR